MRHSNVGRKFGRERGQRRSFLKGLLRNLIMNGKILTTEARAKEIKILIEPLVTKARKQTPAVLRLLISRLSSKEAAYKLYHEIGPRYAERRGGYVRVIKNMKKRLKDASPTAYIEFV